MENFKIRLSDSIKRYKSINTFNIKIYFGKYSNKFGFEENLIQRENFEKIVNMLESCNTWDKKDESTVDKFINVPEKIVDTNLVYSSPYDLLVKIESKNKTNFFWSDNTVVNYKSYTKNNHTFTTVVIKNTPNDDIYYLTLQIDNLNKFQEYYTAESTILKIIDILNCVRTDKEQIDFNFYKK